MTPARRFEAVAALAVLALAASIAGVGLYGEPKPLAVVAASPGDGAAEVPTVTQVTITFSRPVDEPSVRAALSIEPPTEGFVSAAGRRAAFTPRAGLRADTDYTLTVGTGIRDRAGRSLPRPVAIRFRTRGQRLVVRTADGRLLRVTLGVCRTNREPREAEPLSVRCSAPSGGFAAAKFLGEVSEGASSAPSDDLAGEAEPIAGPGVGEFAVSATGDVAYVQPAEAVLVVVPAGPRDARRIALPRRVARFAGYGPRPAVEVRQLTWAPGGAALGFLGATGDGASVPYLVRLDEAAPAPESFGPPPDLTPSRSSPLPQVLTKSLAEIVYGRDSFAFTPDGRGAIVRDRNWDFVVLGFDGQRRGTFGPFVAVGNVAPSGRMVAFVDVDPADPELRRQVVAYERAGRLRSLTSAERDSHSPRFAHRTDRVVFAAAAGPPGARRYGIEVVDLGSGVLRRLTSPPPGERDEAPEWSPDDAWISFRRAPLDAPERGAVWLVPADGGAARPLPIAATDARWSP